MATTSEARALPFFSDLLGQPLQAGFIYIGQAGLDPVAYPAVIHSDVEGTTVVAQPVRTTNGHAASSGALIHLFVPIPYSITILDSARRVVYASLNETDPVITAISTSSVQSAVSFADLRARSGSSSNQVWVANIGMYLYNSGDTTSPENLPFVVVGNDGSRYDLSLIDADASFVKVSAASPGPSTPGTWYSWNDANDGATYITNNRGSSSGGFILRNLDSTGTILEGVVNILSDGTLNASGDIGSTSGRLITAAGNVTFSLDGTKTLIYDGTDYSFAGGGIKANGSVVVTEANVGSELVNIFSNRLVGCTLIGLTTPTPGTWAVMVAGVGSTGVNQYVRTA